MRTVGILVLLSFFLSGSAAAGVTIYQSANKVDFVRLDKARKGERAGGLRHPHELDPAQIRRLLGSLHFSKGNLLFRDIEDRRLFEERHVEFLAPYLMEAFKKVSDREVVVVSFFTRESRFAIKNDRLTVFRAFIKDDGLHFRFKKLYAKLVGDRTTQGLERSVQGAETSRVRLESQPGMALVGTKPVHLVWDLQYFLTGAVETPPVPQGRVLLQTHGAPPPAGEKNVRERLKELDQLKEEELITEKEYQKKRRELLREL